MTAAARFRPPVESFFAERAIDPAVASKLGIAERDGSLVFTVRRADGSVFQRTRPLGGPGPAKVLQPSGVPLAPWWVRGVPEYAPVALLTEGESDALAAVSALNDGPLVKFWDLPVAALPGCGFPVDRIVEELRRVECRFVYFALDADEAGRKLTRSARHALDFAGIHTAAVDLPDGSDLAAEAAARPPEKRGEWIADLLLDAESAP